MKLSPAASIVSVALCSIAAAQVTQRVSVASTGVEGSGGCGFSYPPAMSADGRFVAFMSFAENLVVGDTNARGDIFVRDRQQGTTERVSLASNGTQANDHSEGISISADGRYVAFGSWASNLVLGDGNGKLDVFVRDRLSGTTERVSLSSAGVEGDHFSAAPSISADGRYVAFGSGASNLVPGDTNSSMDVFVRDRLTATTERVSVDSSGVEGLSDSGEQSMSTDGRFVTFDSHAPNLVPGDTNGCDDVFIRDRVLGTTELVSRNSAGAWGNWISGTSAISADGRYVAFESISTNLVTSDTNGFSDVFLRDRLNGTTIRASVGTNGSQGNFDSLFPSISSDGRFVSFSSRSSTFVVGDTNGMSDVFLRDVAAGITERISVNSTGVQGLDGSVFSALSAAGHHVAFRSWAGNLVPDDDNGVTDIFVRNSFGRPAFTSLCNPGIGGVISCPCGNSPSGPGKGCDNSASTGGAALSAAGGTILSSDSLVLTAIGEGQNALSILLQSTGSLPGGAVFGQGVRCAGGSVLRRLFSRVATAGTVTFPDYGADDLSISAESASRGDAIQPGQSRWYVVYYRDPIVLGGCPATSTFNSTQTGQVTWSP